MSKRYLSEAGDGEINVLNRLFGRDLGVEGWVVKGQSGGAVGAGDQKQKKPRQIAVPDPSIIWALRGRKK
ncbi:MAG: hypothetical protein CMM76_03370 [Rhodospirillaceae bacterium]|nr:hypothetical protein [Rhodospirillaceae bacterium]